MAKGIYRIRNKRTGKSYIGQTNDLKRRKQEHMSNLDKGTHHNTGMQKDYNKGDKFSFEVLESVNGTREDLNRREMFHIYKHNTFNNGYNQTHGGGHNQSNQRKYTNKPIKSNKGYRRRYRRKQYPIRTYNPAGHKTSGDKLFAYLLIALFILYLISYWPMQFLYGILIILAIIIIAAIAYFGGNHLYIKYFKRKNIFYCPNCKKRVKFVDGHCQNCYKKNKKRMENAEKTKTTTTSIDHPKGKNAVSNNKDSYPYCNYNFKKRTIEKLPNQDIENKNKETPKHYTGFKYPSVNGYKFCPKCGKRINNSEGFCNNCTTKYKRPKKKFENKICPKCFSYVPKNAIRCKYCNYYFKTWNKNKNKTNENFNNSKEEKNKYAKELQHKRLGLKSHYKRCPSCDNLINKKEFTCKYCNYEFATKSK